MTFWTACRIVAGMSIDLEAVTIDFEPPAELLEEMLDLDLLEGGDVTFLEYEEGPDGPVVRNDGGGVWRPDASARAEIEMSGDPEGAALRLVDEAPMRGRWSC